MPNFRVYVSDQSTPHSVYEEMETRIWGDPAFGDRPSRITPANDRQHRFFRCAPGTLVALAAVLDAEVVVQNDGFAVFTSWPIEHASSYPPAKVYPLVGFSALVHYQLDKVGHYLLAMRMENTAAFNDITYAGGVVLVHIDVTES